MAANIFRERKKPESIKRGEKLGMLLCQKTQLDAFMKLSTGNNWGLAAQAPLEVGACSAGTASGSGSLPAWYSKRTCEPRVRGWFLAVLWGDREFGREWVIKRLALFGFPYSAVPNL